MSTGPTLRRARLDAGLTIDQVSEITKIPLWIVQSIERDELARVPGGIFVRGYLAAFARAVGIDANEILTSHFGSREIVTIPAPEVRRPGYTGTPLWQVAALIGLIIATAIVWRDAWRAADAQASVRSSAELATRVRPSAPPSPGSTVLRVVTQDRSARPPVKAEVVTAAVTTTVVSETPAPVVAPHDQATTSTTDPTSGTSGVDEPIAPSEIDAPSSDQSSGDVIDVQ